MSKKKAEALKLLKQAADAYQIAAYTLNDFVSGEKPLTLDELKACRGTVYRCESEAQRARDDAIQLLEAD